MALRCIKIAIQFRKLTNWFRNLGWNFDRFIHNKKMQILFISKRGVQGGLIFLKLFFNKVRGRHFHIKNCRIRNRVDYFI